MKGALAVLVTVTVASGCGDGGRTLPTCAAGSRLGLIAQSVPAAAYVPCVAELPTGWSIRHVDVDDDGTTIDLDSDRADRPVEITLRSSCDLGPATPIAPRDEGVRTYQLIESITPRYTGRIIDVFPGGCITASYDFARGAHVALITELQQAVALYSRRELAQGLQAQLDLTLDP